MENITLEQIDLIMKRANVTYAEAKDALESSNGNPVEALILLEKAQKLKGSKCQVAASCGKTLWDSTKSFIKKLHATRFIIKKEEKNVIELPLSIALIIYLFSFYISTFALIIAYCYGYRIRITGETEIAEKINSTINFNKQ